MSVEKVKPILETYGLTPYMNLRNPTQLDYDRVAFALRLPPDRIHMTRVQLFQRIADKLLPKYFEWHVWCLQMIDALCNERWIAFAGCSSCVSGDTRILNPVTGEQPTIQELVETQTPPMVMTLQGPVQAEIPYLKGVAEIFEVELENGTRFKATGDHRVLAIAPDPQLFHFVHVSQLKIGQSLASYVPRHQPSTSGISPSILERDAPCSRKTVEDFQDGYPHEFHSDDGRLLQVEDNDRLNLPSLDDVPRHIRIGCGDDRVSSLEYILASSQFFPPSSGYFLDQDNFWDRPFEVHYDPKTGEPEYQLSQPYVQCHSNSPRPYPFAGPVHDCVRTPSCESCYDSPPINSRFLDSYDWKVAQSKVVSIRTIGEHEFFDIHVPGPEHYFAEGTIHHNSSKTHHVAGFSVVWWLCLPDRSSVTYCSTTKEMLRKRAWANIQSCYWGFNVRNFGNMIDSRMIWQAVKGDSKHSISGVAVEDGAIDKVAENLKGVHTWRQLLVIDEANKIPRAIDDSVSNSYAYPADAGGEYIEVKIANPMSKLDAFGLFSEPKDGWNSVSVDDDEWRTKPKYDGRTGILVRFDALKSPNITNGKVVSRHLPTKEQVDMAVKRAGSENDPLFWSNKRGFWPPEGITQNVFSESILTASRCFANWTFIGHTFMVAGFDPAFSAGGDRAVFRAARCGEVDGGFGIQLMPIEVVPLNAAAVDKAGNPVPLSYQLVEGLRRMATNWRVPPANILMDTTGEGGAIADIAAREWSAEIMRCEFSGKATEKTVSYEDNRICRDVYKNQATEIWFTGREFFNAGQVRGIDPTTASQLCNRTYTPDEAGRKRFLESKREMKLRLSGDSPDESDGTLLCIEAARRRGLEIKPMGLTATGSTDFDREVELAVDLITENLYEEDSIPV